MEKLLMTDALDERDFLLKKINSDIAHARFIAVMREKDTKLQDGTSVEDFEKEAKAAYQSIMDQIDRYTRLDAAIVQSNAETTIELSDGTTITKAKAISLKNMIKQDKYYVTRLTETLRMAHDRAIDNYQSLSKVADNTREQFLLASVQAAQADKKASTKDATDSQKSVVDDMVKGLEPKLIDPLDIEEKIKKLDEDYKKLVKDLDTKLKISNATTYVEF